MTKNTYIFDHYTEYGIFDHRIPLRWSTIDGNTYEIRKERLNRLISLLKELKIPYSINN